MQIVTIFNRFKQHLPYNLQIDIFKSLCVLAHESPLSSDIKMSGLFTKDNSWYGMTHQLLDFFYDSLLPLTCFKWARGWNQWTRRTVTWSVPPLSTTWWPTTSSSTLTAGKIPTTTGVTSPPWIFIQSAGARKTEKLCLHLVVSAEFNQILFIYGKRIRCGELNLYYCW